MISAEEDHVPPAGRTAEPRRILLAACRIRSEAFVEEVKGQPLCRRPIQIAACRGDARVGLEPDPSMTAQ
jgi:hypothetical protein